MTDSGIIQRLNINKIRHPAVQLRSLLDNIEELASSIDQHGLLQPIVVRPVYKGYEVVAGNRRLAAVKLLKLRKITCHVVELSDREAYEISLVENVQHKTMNPTEEAKAFDRYVKQNGWGSVSELAKRIGRSQEFVTKRIQLLRLPQRVQEEIIRQRITPSVALELLPLEQDSVEELVEFVVDNSMTKQEVRRLVKASKLAKLKINGPKSSLVVTKPARMGRTKTSSDYEKELYLSDMAIRKSIAVIKSVLVYFDDILSEVGDEWVLKELLMQYRQIHHGDIDTFLKLKKTLRTRMLKGYKPLLEVERPLGQKEILQDNEIDKKPLHMWMSRGIWQ